MGYVLEIRENGDYIVFNDGSYIAFNGLFGESSSSSSSSSSSTELKTSSSSSLSSESSNINGWYITWNYQFNCSDQSYQAWISTYSQHIKYDVENISWWQTFSSEGNIIIWEASTWFPDPLFENPPEFYVNDYPVPLPEAPANFCDESSSSSISSTSSSSPSSLEFSELSFLSESSQSLSSESSNINGWYITWNYQFNCSDQSYQAWISTYSQHIKHDVENVFWWQKFSSEGNIIIWEASTWFPDPLFENPPEFYVNDYPVPLPEAPENFCPSSESSISSESSFGLTSLSSESSLTSISSESSISSLGFTSSTSSSCSCLFKYYNGLEWKYPTACWYYDGSSWKHAKVKIRLTTGQWL